MVNIGLYPLENPSSSYIDVLKEKGYNLFSLEQESDRSNYPVLEAIIIDCAVKPNGERVGQICELLLKEKSNTYPLIFLLVTDSTPIERFIYLELGATIVFDQHTPPNEFQLILSNMLQTKTKEASVPKMIEERLKLNSDNLSICIENEQEISLTPLEYKLVSYLKGKCGQRATYEELYKVLWNGHVANKQYRVANIVFHIRKKIEKNVSEPQYLKTIRTIGYVLCL